VLIPFLFISLGSSAEALLFTEWNCVSLQAKFGSEVPLSCAEAHAALAGSSFGSLVQKFGDAEKRNGLIRLASARGGIPGSIAASPRLRRSPLHSVNAAFVDSLHARGQI
jgi:hypothetical protein